MRHVMLTLALCSACGTPVEESAAARQDAVIIRGDDDGIIIMNGLPPHELGTNLLLNDAATRATLITSKLASASFTSGALNDAVTFDPRAARVLGYLVRCALEPSSTVTAAGATYRGELGLCTEWASAGVAGNSVCQGRVTSCLLGLSNVVGAHVPVSMRGNGPDLSAAASMRAASFTAAGELVASLKRCTSPSAGVARDCGWEPVDDTAAEAAGIRAVFACTPGSLVKLGAGSTCSGTMLGTMTPGSDKVLRVCAGVKACDHADALAENEGACGSWTPSIAFTCPANGAYVVMQRDYAVAVPANPPGTMTVGQTGNLGPASETQLFPVREATFYGTLFEGALGRTVTRDPVSGQLSTSVPTVKAPVFERLYSCVDTEWDSPDAYSTQRLCGLDGQCLSHRQGFCQTECTSVMEDSPAGSGWFLGCKGADGLFYDDGLTTFLREGCDLISTNPLALACKR